MSLTKYFASSKKRDLSSEQSEGGNDTKKKKEREDSSTTSFSENDNVFLEGLKSNDCCSILVNCFKTIQENWGKLRTNSWRIVELESKVVSLSTKVGKIEYTAEKMEQY